MRRGEREERGVREKRRAGGQRRQRREAKGEAREERREDRGVGSGIDFANFFVKFYKSHSIAKISRKKSSRKAQK